MRKARGTPGGDEPLGDPVGTPWFRAVRSRAEHERVGPQLHADVPGPSPGPKAMRHQHIERLGIELDPVAHFPW